MQATLLIFYLLTFFIKKIIVFYTIQVFWSGYFEGNLKGYVIIDSDVRVPACKNILLNNKDLFFFM